jgi:hypothetical protein
VTINRSQGQEFEKLLFNLTSPSFTHGQLYVALSRIRKSENIKIFCTDEQIVDDNVLLMNTRLFLWDEISNNNLIDIIAAFEAMKNFKNSILIVQGDLDQMPPVVEFGTKQQVIDSSIYCFELIKTFEILVQI